MNRVVRIGAHVSISGGLDKVVTRAKNIGANTTQIFSSAPQNWKANTYTDEKVTKFKEELIRTNISPIFIHAIYLINLASDNLHLYGKSIDSLILDMQFAKRIGAEGVIVHIGSHLGMGLGNVMGRVIDAIERILVKSPKETFFIIENSAGGGGKIGTKFEDIATIMGKIGSKRIKFCFDTAHAFALGYPINTKIGLKKTIEEIKKIIGLENLVVIHTNDSKVPQGKGIDRHENIGEGFIGTSGFRLILNHPELKNLPFIIETPGFGSEGPDAKNIQIFKSLVK